MNMKNFLSLFETIWRKEPKSLSSFKLVLDEEKRLKSTVFGLNQLINIGLMKMEELRTIQQAVTKHQTEMEANVNAEFQLKMTVSQKIGVPYGQWVTNCTRCNITCHKPCGSENEKANCDVMDHSKAVTVRTCRVCPGNCMWNVHANEPFRWESIQQTEETSTEAIRHKYEIKLNRKLTVEELIQEVTHEIEANERAVLGRFFAVVKCNERLDQMANREESLTPLQHINQQIVDEKGDGTEERIKSLKTIRLLCVINILNSI